MVVFVVLSVVVVVVVVVVGVAGFVFVDDFGVSVRQQ
jgi:hypothetical protein